MHNWGINQWFFRPLSPELSDTSGPSTVHSSQGVSPLITANPQLASNSSNVFFQTIPGIPITERTICHPQCSNSNMISNASSDWEKYTKIIGKIAEQSGIKQEIDSVSMFSMCNALHYSGINSLTKAQQIHLEITPPGPVFHTWVALHGCGLFDGSNQPECVSELNYVQRVREQAKRLENWGIPLIVVWMERFMDAPEKEKMLKLFDKDENILMLSLESDLANMECSEVYSPARLKDYSTDFDPERISGRIRFKAFDILRDGLCHEFPKLLNAAEKKSLDIKKINFQQRLVALGKQSITYIDIDNTWIRKPMFQILPYGYTQRVKISNLNMKEDKADQLIYNSKEQLIKNITSHGLLQPGVNILSQKDPAFLLSQADKLYDLLHRCQFLELSFVSDANFYSVSHTSVSLQPSSTTYESDVPEQEKVIFELVGLNSLFYHWNEGMNQRQRSNSVACQKLCHMQQLLQFHEGRDMSWRSDRMNLPFRN